MATTLRRTPGPARARASAQRPGLHDLALGSGSAPLPCSATAVKPSTCSPRSLGPCTTPSPSRRQGLRDPRRHLLSIDRVAMSSGRDQPYYSGKHKRHGVDVQALADPAGRLVWASGALPSARHDMGAAREHGLLDALTDSGVPVIADSGYRGTGFAVPQRRRPADPETGRRRLSRNQREVNSAHARHRGPGERANAWLKSWKVLRRIRCCPLRRPAPSRPSSSSSSLADAKWQGLCRSSAAIRVRTAARPLSSYAEIRRPREVDALSQFRDGGGGVLLVGDRLEPVHDVVLIVAFVDREVDHEPVGCRTVPCSSSASKRTRSPGRMTSSGPPRRWHRPTPSVTKTVWLSGGGASGCGRRA